MESIDDFQNHYWHMGGVKRPWKIVVNIYVLLHIERQYTDS